MKPVVHYKPYEDPLNEILVGRTVWVFPIDHPSEFVTNTVLARTSRVVSIGEDGEFETENTIYVIGCECLGLAHQRDCPEWVLPY